MSGTSTATTTTAASAAAPPTASTAAPPASAPTATIPISTPSAVLANPAVVLDTLTNAIYGLQRQMFDFAMRLSDIEGQPLPHSHAPAPFQFLQMGPTSAAPGFSYGTHAASAHTALNGTGSSFSPSTLDTPGFGGIQPSPPATSVVIHTATAAPSVPIT